MMKGKDNRTVEWHEALAVADNGKLLFAAQERSMDGVISASFNPKNYEEGIWLCSVSDYPQFGGRNYFDLNDEEKEATADSWTKLGERFKEFMKSS